LELKKGANVYTADGDKVGTIERVVLDPRTKEVTHVVVEKGFLFAEDKVVPISLLGPTTDDRVTLREGEHEFDKLPPFIKTEFVRAEVESPQRVELRPDEGQEVSQPTPYAQPYYWYPPLGVGWWTGIPYPSGLDSEFVRTDTINIPEGTVALEEGARVVGSDEKQVGDIEEVLTDPETDRVTHFVIAEGLLLKERRLVPANWVDSILEDRVFLCVPSDVVEDLPEYHEAA
jgi:uncharacterized protein YrrD